MAIRRVLPRTSLLRSLVSRAYSSSPAATVDRVKLVFEHHKPEKIGRHGHSSPIIFMHGLFGSKTNNRTVSRFLARDLKRHVYTLDLRNHGDSPHVPRHDYLAMADDVAGFIAEHRLENPTLIGHSMGAKVAMTLALDQPSLIANIVSVDNAPVDATLNRTFASYIRGMREIEEAGVSKRSDADAILAAYEPNEPVRHFLLGNMYRATVTQENKDGEAVEKEVFKFRVPLDILGKNLNNLGDFPFRNPDERRFEKPALFVRGTQSAYVPDEVLPVIGRFFPLFRLADIDAGHWVISQKPMEFFNAVSEFLNESSE